MSFPYTYPNCGCQPFTNQQATTVIQPNVFFTSSCGPVCVYEQIYHLRNETRLVQNAVAMIKGLTAPYDTQGHIYIFEVASLDADDGVNVLKPNIIPLGIPGRWKLWM